MHQWRQDKRLWDKKIEKVSKFRKELIPALKTFTPKNSNLEVLDSYDKGLDDSYWSKWEGNSYKQEEGSFIDHQKLAAAAVRLGLREKSKVRETCEMLERGASIGVDAEGRWPSTGPNSSTVYEFGSRVADSLQTAVKDGIMYGPMHRDEIPWTDFKVSPMTVRLKPNGAARIIMNLSFPHEPQLGSGEACSPNEGMKCFQEFEPVSMGSDSKWRRMMYIAGRPAEMIKADWDMAYKHVSVCWADHHLQVIEFGGRFFIEKCLTFGGGGVAPPFTICQPLC